MLVGKLQARIVRENNAYYIEDQGGIAATLVNGSPITRYGPLTEADQIEIGTTTIKIVRAVATRRRRCSRSSRCGRWRNSRHRSRRQSARHTHTPQHTRTPPPRRCRPAYAAPQALEHAPRHASCAASAVSSGSRVHAQRALFIARAPRSSDQLAGPARRRTTASASVAVAAQTASAPLLTTAAQRFESAYDVNRSACPHPAPDARLRMPSSHAKKPPPTNCLWRRSIARSASNCASRRT